MTIDRIVLLTVGWEDLPKSVSVHGASGAERLREPTPAVLVGDSEGWILLDTGFNTALVRDVALRRRFYPDADYVPILPDEDEPLLSALDRVGVALDDVRAVALSHLHADHAGGLKHFAGRVPVHLQRRELEFGLSPRAEADTAFRVDFDDPRIDWRLAEGDAQVASGVTAVATPGHTPGHQSFVVELSDRVGGGGYVFAFDAADLRDNIERELAIGSFVDVTPEDTVTQIRRLKAIAAERGFALVPGHDPVVWPQLSRELGARFG